MINIGNFTFKRPLIMLAPMAGVTDQPFRHLCYQLGADLCVSEMVTSQLALWHTKKTQRRLDHKGEQGIRSVQIAGTDPIQLAASAKRSVQLGAQIIDINMGCPAKKVCKVQAGSALLKNEKLVEKILLAVVDAVDVPVSLKIRTGWDNTSKNALQIAKIAEDCGIKMLSIHGRTRADKFNGVAEYDTIAQVKSHVSIPIIANGDICNAQQAQAVLQQTQADGLMIGRAAQGNPWLFRQIKQLLFFDETVTEPSRNEISNVLCTHLQHLYHFYGEASGLKIARKHIGWYLKNKSAINSVDANHFKAKINHVESATLQLQLVNQFFSAQASIAA